MKTICVILLFALGPFALSQGSFEATFVTNGLTLEQTGKATMKLGGLVTMYDAALYLPAGVKPSDVLSDVPKRLEIYYRKSISDKVMIDGAEKGIASNETPVRIQALRARIDEINKAYQSVRPRDRYALTYLPGKGTELSYNGLGKVIIPGADFAAAYFSIWLGTNCPRPEVRDALIGRGK